MPLFKSISMLFTGYYDVYQQLRNALPAVVARQGFSDTYITLLAADSTGVV
jgi:hypothetical protein